MSRLYNSPSNFILYAIEDSGNENVVYVINKDGTLKGTNRVIDVIKLCKERKIFHDIIIVMKHHDILLNRTN